MLQPADHESCYPLQLLHSTLYGNTAGNYSIFGAWTRSWTAHAHALTCAHMKAKQGWENLEAKQLPCRGGRQHLGGRDQQKAKEEKAKEGQSRPTGRGIHLGHP